MAKKVLKNTAIMIGAVLFSYGISFVLQDVFDIWEHITSIFIFAVFIVSLLTDGYIYGIVAAFAGIIAINYAFTYPYFDVDFSAPASIFSAAVMLIISLLTSAFTTKLKRWQELKAEGEKERMRANLLRAVSHDLRTPLTTIYGASSSILDNYDKLNDTQKAQMISGIKEDSEWLIRMVENLLSITRIDTVLDLIEEVLQKMYIYNIKTIEPAAIDYAKHLVRACDLLGEIMAEFENFKKSKKLHSLIVASNDVEEECDKLYLATMHELTKKSTDVLTTLSWYKIYDCFEACSDACEHVSECVGSIVMKNT